MYVSNKRAPTKPSYHINNYNLHWVSHVKYLGVFVDSKLSWNYHVTHVSAKVLNLLRRHMYTCQSPSKLKAFRALVLPILDYASVVWNPHTHKNVSTLEKYKIKVPVGCVEADLTLKLPNGQNLQLTAAESVTGHHYLPGESICLTTLYDIFHQLIFLSFDDYFTLSSTATRSHSFSLLCKQSSINSFRYSFFVNSIFFWNNIPYSILSISRHVSFKNLLYNYLCSNQVNFLCK